MMTTVPEHEELADELNAYLDGALDSTTQARVASHLAQCATCRDELAELRAVRQGLRALPAITAPRAFTLPVSAPSATTTPPAPTATASAVRPNAVLTATERTVTLPPALASVLTWGWRLSTLAAAACLLMAVISFAGGAPLVETVGPAQLPLTRVAPTVTAPGAAAPNAAFAPSGAAPSGAGGVSVTNGASNASGVSNAPASGSGQGALPQAQRAAPALAARDESQAIAPAANAERPHPKASFQSGPFDTTASAGANGLTALTPRRVIGVPVLWLIMAVGLGSAALALWLQARRATRMAPAGASRHADGRSGGRGG